MDIEIKNRDLAKRLVSEGLYPKPKKADSAIRNLALAILLQAFRDAIAPKRLSNKEWELWRRDAMDWFFANEYYPGSFKWVCEILAMDPDQLREWLRGYRAAGKGGKKEMVAKLIRFQLPH